GLNLALLTWHAWRQRGQLELDRAEEIGTRVWLASWLAIPLVAALSALLTTLLPLQAPGWAYALPPMCYGLLGLQAPLLSAYQKRLQRRLPECAMPSMSPAPIPEPARPLQAARCCTRRAPAACAWRR